MKIVVTGGAGFIGSHLVDAYVEADHEVIVLDDLSSGRRENVHPRARLAALDIRSPEARALVERERPEVLSHHAAQMSVRRSVEEPRVDADINILGMLNLLEGARAGGVRRILFASSGGAIYGEQERFPADEGHPTVPVSPYGVSKRAGELYLSCWYAAYGIPYVALRYSNVYGPRQDPHGEAGVVAIFTRALLAGRQPVINGDGMQTRDYVFVGDVVGANLAALSSEYIGPVNIGTGIETDVNDLYERLRVAAGVGVRPRHGPPRPGEQRRSVIAPSLAARVLGWRPSRSLDDGLREVVAYFRDRVGEDASGGPVG
jgi:UDP-glucose 4-epimerase